eukprot:3075650-Amphidinium_carterae.2
MHGTFQGEKVGRRIQPTHDCWWYSLMGRRKWSRAAVQLIRKAGEANVLTYLYALYLSRCA